MVAVDAGWGRGVELVPGCGQELVGVGVLVDADPGGLGDSDQAVPEGRHMGGDHDGHVGQVDPVVGRVVWDRLEEAVVEGDGGVVAGLVQGAVVGLAVGVVAPGGAGQVHEAIALDGDLSCDGFLGLGDLGVDPA